MTRNWRKRTAVLLGMLAWLGIRAQDVKVVDYETKVPVGGVTVYNETRQIVLHTNNKGIVNLRIFKPEDTLYFSHPDYETVRYTKKDIIANRYRVELYRPFTMLHTVVLSVSRSEKEKKDISRQIAVVDRAEIYKQLASYTPGVLERLPGITVQRTQGGGGSPIIRGLEANRVLLVLDGVRMNNAIYRTGHLHNSITIEPTILERLEVIYGPSAIYGSDALGGVIHFITQTPVVNNPKEMSGTVLGRFATATREASFHFSLNVSKPRWASLTSISYSDFGDIRMGTLRLHGFEDWGIVKEYSDNTATYFNPEPVVNADLTVQPNTAYKQYGVMNKTVFELSPRTLLIFDTQFHSTSDIPRFDKLTEYKDGKLKYAEWRYGPMELFFFSPRAEVKTERQWLDKAKFIVSYQRVRESRIWRKFTDSIRRYRKEKVHILTLNTDFTASPGRHDHLDYGAEFVYNRVLSDAYGRLLVVEGHRITAETGEYYVPTRYPNAGSYYMTFAAYANWEHRFNRRHQVALGMRATQTYLKAKWKDLQLVDLPFQSVLINNFAFTPTFHYIYSPEHWKISLTLGSGFRSPNVDDVGKIREKKGKLLVPNVNLRPEYLYMGELGIRNSIWNGVVEWQAYVYYNLITDYIQRKPYVLNGFSQIMYDGEMVDIYANVNGGKARIYGTDVALIVKPHPHIRWQTSYHWLKGRKENGEPMPSIPPAKWLSKLSYKNDFFEILGIFEYHAFKPLDEYDTESGIDNLDQSPQDPITGEYLGFPAWHTFDLAFNYYLTHNLTLSVGVDNIFDIHYKRFASAVSEPGRNLKIQISGRF
ncbi:MAG: TonB-dependent receptor [Chlorobi bacterium]|nr:TonB-dependent receptor [Chlorobiota bacterium]